MKQKLKLVLVLVLIGSLGFILHHFGWIERILDFIKPESLESFINRFGVWAPLVFMLLYYGLVLAFISAAAFTILSGLLFGKFWGSVYVIITATLAAQTAFFITRKLGPEKLSSLKNKKGIGPLISKIEKQTDQHGFQSVFLLRCLFTPYIPLSYAAGMIKTLKTRDFFFATLFANMIFAPAFVFLGDSLLEDPKALISPITLVILVLAVPRIIKKLKPDTHV